MVFLGLIKSVLVFYCLFVYVWHWNRSLYHRPVLINITQQYRFSSAFFVLFLYFDICGLDRGLIYVTGVCYICNQWACVLREEWCMLLWLVIFLYFHPHRSWCYTLLHCQPLLFELLIFDYLMFLILFFLFVWPLNFCFSITSFSWFCFSCLRDL